MQRIKDEDRVWKETTEEIQEVIEKYFLKLFTASSLDGKLSHREQVKQVTSEENVELISKIMAEEVRVAVFSMHPDKAPGLDGLNPAFSGCFGI